MTFDFSKKLFVSTIAEDCAAAAREHSLGLEIAEFCYAPNMDTDSAAHFRRVSQLTAESGCGLRLLLHAPFAELSPCAIDPLVRDVVRRRFDQALFAADVIGAKRIVFHSGFIPFVYYKEYFIDESVKFWRDFLKNAPNDIYFLLEKRVLFILFFLLFLSFYRQFWNSSKSLEKFLFSNFIFYIFS